jgi:hypothetical protein
VLYANRYTTIEGASEIPIAFFQLRHPGTEYLKDPTSLPCKSLSQSPIERILERILERRLILEGPIEKLK